MKNNLLTVLAIVLIIGVICVMIYNSSTKTREGAKWKDSRKKTLKIHKEGMKEVRKNRRMIDDLALAVFGKSAYGNTTTQILRNRGGSPETSRLWGGGNPSAALAAKLGNDGVFGIKVREDPKGGGGSLEEELKRKFLEGDALTAALEGPPDAS